MYVVKCLSSNNHLVMDRQKSSFTCYFCHKKVEDETELGHTSVCGNVLIPCPYKCGSYVPRMEMLVHKQECVNRVGRSMTRLTTTTESLESYEDDGPSTATASLDRRLNVPNKDFRNLFEKLQNDLQKLSRRFTNYEQSNFNNRYLNQQNDSRKNQDLEKLKYQNQLLIEWKKAVDFKLETLKQSISSCENAKNESEFHWAGLQQKLMLLDKLRMDVNLYRDTFLKEQNYNRQANLEFANNLDEFKDMFEEANATTSALWNDQKQAIEEIQKDINHIKELIEEQKAKHTSVIFDIKTISQIASEISEKFEIQEREFENFKKKFEQLKLDMEILENLALGDNSFGTGSTSPGHIIWKISDFKAKMAKAKDINTVIKSPVFYTHDFGYKIRALVYLNGLKKWKDRYALISIHVLKSELDALLKWPCYIEGTVTLRDVENPEDPKNFSKHIVAKRQAGDEENEDPQESSFSYIFIPHTTLTKSQYLKDDTIFLEIRIEQNRKLLTETTL